MDVSYSEMNEWLNLVRNKLGTGKRDEVLSRIPVKHPGELKPNEYSRVVRIAKALLEDTSYNWKSDGPGGCDSHGIEHPCGRCIQESRDPRY